MPWHVYCVLLHELCWEGTVRGALAPSCGWECGCRLCWATAWRFCTMWRMPRAAVWVRSQACLCPAHTLCQRVPPCMLAAIWCSVPVSGALCFNMLVGCFGGLFACMVVSNSHDTSWADAAALWSHATVLAAEQCPSFFACHICTLLTQAVQHPTLCSLWAAGALSSWSSTAAVARL